MSDIVVPFGLARHATAPAGPPPLYPARVARQVALAHALQARITSGEFDHQAQMAHALGLSRARVSQLFDLLLLSPDIQEEILSLKFPPGAQPLNEAALRPIARLLLWTEQRRAWARLRRAPKVKRHPTRPASLVRPSTPAGSWGRRRAFRPGTPRPLRAASSATAPQTENDTAETTLAEAGILC